MYPHLSEMFTVIGRHPDHYIPYLKLYQYVTNTVDWTGNLSRNDFIRLFAEYDPQHALFSDTEIDMLWDALIAA